MLVFLRTRFQYSPWKCEQRQHRFSLSSRAWYLLMKFTIKFKKIIFKHKICHIYDIFSGNHFVLEFIVLFSKDFQASTMLNTRIKRDYSWCNKDCPFRTLYIQVRTIRKGPGACKRQNSGLVLTYARFQESLFEIVRFANWILSQIFFSKWWFFSSMVT